MYFKRFILGLVCCLALIQANGKTLNDHIMNRPYADLKAWHLGFSVGMQFQDLRFTQSGITAFDGTKWYVEQPSVSPGFCVNALVDLRLNRFFNFRFNPGLYFGSKSIEMMEAETHESFRQTIKSTYLVFPLDLKFSAIRYKNSRPYISAGVMPAIDITSKKADPIRLKPADVYLTFGIGCDFYLPYFKLIPEIKFCFGLMDVLKHDRPDLIDDPVSYRYTEAIKRAASSMVVITFYFE